MSPSAMTLGLGNIQRLLDALDHPEHRYRSVLVAGTNGKGSVTAYLAAILRRSGLRVGWYSSPHIYSVTERIRIDGARVTLEHMEEAAARILPLYEQIHYSYFEALTAIAFLIFAEHGVEMAVLEVGLGGRFDATNAVSPELSVLTQVGLDHRRILGDTREEILREKLGIARTGTPLLVGPLSEDLLAMTRDRARNDRVELVTLDDIGEIALEAFSFDGMSARVRTRQRDYGSIRLPFVGEHQLANALLSIGAAERLVASVGDLDAAAQETGLEGRFDVHRIGETRVILDVAHNDDALMASAKTLARLSPRDRNAMVLGILERKELFAFPPRMAQWIRRLYLVQPPDEDGLAAPRLLDRIGLGNVRDKGLDVVLQGSCEGERMRFMEQLVGGRVSLDAVLVTGSHRTVEFFGKELRRFE
jgi:dihydrofolate synthase/folylpolyglutamate synthase